MKSQTTQLTTFFLVFMTQCAFAANSGSGGGQNTNEHIYKFISCPAGHTGAIKYDCQTKDDPYNCFDQFFPNQKGWAKAKVTNSCVLSEPIYSIPTQNTEIKDGVQEESCDSYYGVAHGTYSGTVYKYGTYTTTYSEATKITDTKFEITSVDFTSCVAQITDIIQETDELACPAGQTGKIQRFRVKAQDSLGQVSYPYGEAWIVSNNNCTSIQIDTQLMPNADTIPDGLLKNISVTSSSLQVAEAFSKYLNSLSASDWATNERHKLIVNIDDLSNGKYSASKVGAVISKFQSVVGAGNSDIEIALPRTIDKYTGNGDITAKAVNEKTVVFKDISYEGGDARLIYMQLSKKATEIPQSKEILINVIPRNFNLKGVFSN
ncbi:hypothetical protein GHO40_16885 [Pseudomonas helleri]|uniref:Uncharacterized protein n=1 Tax=Pseudomonas helleri TaxID=1608996 RepID=A0A7X1WAP4_9PSED|nr:hypothetical protein [Pseudomonas helleri]MQT48382.1 hypothetical protein [Pseudomonas helleri]